jgi:hypothetical protein
MSQTFLIKNGDVMISNMSGTPHMIVGKEALRQDLLEDLSINTLPNGYGAGIPALVGYVPYDTMPFTMDIDKLIRSSIDTMQALQNSIQSIYRPTDEQIAGISFLRVFQHPTDPRVYLYYVNVDTVAGVQLKVSGNIQTAQQG